VTQLIFLLDGVLRLEKDVDIVDEEVFIKTIGQTILTYVIGIFMVPGKFFYWMEF